MKVSWGYLWSFYRKLSEHKHLELELSYQEKWVHIFTYGVSWTRKTDHAGLRAWFEIMGAEITLDIYDNRHWNDYTNDWTKVGEDFHEPDICCEEGEGH